MTTQRSTDVHKYASRLRHAVNALHAANPAVDHMSLHGDIDILVDYANIVFQYRTLRDEFAAAALPQILAITAQLLSAKSGANPDPNELTAAVGKQCYVYADAMLEARKP